MRVTLCQAASADILPQHSGAAMRGSCRCPARHSVCTYKSCVAHGGLTLHSLLWVYWP